MVKNPGSTRVQSWIGMTIPSRVASLHHLILHHADRSPANQSSDAITASPSSSMSRRSSSAA